MGRLYNIRSGRDLKGDQISRDRPPDVARSNEVGPERWNLDLTFTKDLRLGESVAEGGGGRGVGRRSEGRSIRFLLRIDNLLNHTQPSGYGNVRTLSLFGQSTGYTDG